MRNNRISFNIKNFLAILYYKITKNVYGRGYERYKQNLIKKIINKENIEPITYVDERIVEIPWVINEINKKGGKLLDAGSTLNFEYILKKLKNRNKIFITTLYPEKNSYNDLRVSYTYENLSDLSFKDQFFDVVACISTLEHVGFNNDIYNYGKFKQKEKNKTDFLNVISNLFRVLKKNGTLLISIPFGKKGIYENMQQFDLAELNKIINNLNIKKQTCLFYRYYNNKWCKSSVNECSNIEPNIKKIGNRKIVQSANSVALIKLIK